MQEMLLILIQEARNKIATPLIYAKPFDTQAIL